MKKRYVYYDNKTGFIKEILSKRKRGRGYYIECDNSEVEGFIMGTKSIYKYLVAYDKLLKKNVIMDRNNVIRFRDIKKELYKIPYRKNVESDLTIGYFTDDVIELTLDVSRMSPMSQTDFSDDIMFERGTEIRLIVKEKNTGKQLKEIILEAQELLNAGQMFFKVPYCEEGNIEFHTYKMFESYSWYKGSSKLISPMKDKIKFDIHKADIKERSKNFSYHLVVTPTEKGIKIKNNIESLKMIRFRDTVEFFIVDRHDPNILYDKFYLDKKQLEKKKMAIDLNTNMEGKTILYNHKYISVLLKG